MSYREQYLPIEIGSFSGDIPVEYGELRDDAKLRHILSLGSEDRRKWLTMAKKTGNEYFIRSIEKTM